jgi:hypothetical protein
VHEIHGLYYIFNVVDDRLQYSAYMDIGCTDLVNTVDWIVWGDTAVRTLEDHARYLCEPFCGPTQPPPSPVIKKIREMAKRREQYV